MADFLVDTLNQLLKQGVLRTDHKLLVLCGGETDRLALMQCGFQNVTISNIDQGQDPDRYRPFKWADFDAENIPCAAGEYDVCLAHSGLHHCRSPHRALLEMYRVARRAVIVFEPYDNLLTRLGVRLGLGQEYEVAAVAGNDCTCGGLHNSPIPNYVYRWTTREIEKTIHTYAPVGKHEFHYFYAMRINWLRARGMRSRVLRGLFRLMGPCARLVGKIFPRQCNNFGFVVLKPRLPYGLHDWLEWNGSRVQLDLAWMRRRYSHGAWGVPADFAVSIGQSANGNGHPDKALSHFAENGAAASDDRSQRNGAPTPEQTSTQSRWMRVHPLYAPFMFLTRRPRMHRFETRLRVREKTTILDVGGHPYNWKFVRCRPHVVLLNLRLPTDIQAPTDQFELIRGDGRSMPYPDRHFDIAFANSTIEHVGTYDDQRRFAEEMRRVGNEIWVQTPARVFPIDPHFISPVVHWFPRSWQRRCIRWVSLRCWLDRNAWRNAEELVNDTRFISRREMQNLFPDCEIITERFFFWPKSYIAVRAAAGSEFVPQPFGAADEAIASRPDFSRHAEATPQPCESVEV